MPYLRCHMNTDITLAAKAVKLSQAIEEAGIHMPRTFSYIEHLIGARPYPCI